MIKAFLSHSSKDKESYVRIVANKLKKDMDIIYDEYTFEAGNRTLDEIMKGLDKTELFVLFISENSLQSEWVKKEVLVATDKLGGRLKQFYPIIIDKKITFEDKRIPEWLQKEYNLKYVSKPTVAAKRIEQKLREISLEKHPKLKKKNNLCIGRNKILDEFEERLDNFEMDKPKCIIATGFLSIGRRTFLKHALEKTDIIEQYYNPNSIYLDTNDSIEDFILKLNDLGFINVNSKLTNLLSKSQEYKINLAITILKEIQESKELILILDNGCIVNYERTISNWFKSIINSDDIINRTIICTASKYKVNYKEVKTDNFYSIHVDDLTVSERKRLFKRLLEIYNIDISVDDFNYISSQFYGFPEQILYCVDYIHRTNVENVKNNLHDIREFNDQKASMLIKHYTGNDDVLSFIRLIAQFEIISLDFLFQIVDKDKYFEILEQLVTENICEYFGYDGQFIRLNDSIRDYIIRNRLKITKSHSERLKKHVEDFIKSDDINEKDSSDYLFSIKEAILDGQEINDSLLFPSHFLRTMKDLYYKGNSLRVVELADKVLEKESFIDTYLVNDIKYFLCLALAKTKNKRVLSEVQKLNGDQHNFILGYYYRIIGRYSDALDRLKQVVTSKYIQSRAKREIVHILIQTEGYSKALSYAKDNYIENKNNIFHTQLYFTCLINSEKYYEHKQELKDLVEELENMSFEINSDMGKRANALYLAKCDNDETKSLAMINDAISMYLDSHYSILTKFDIAFNFKNIKAMEEAIEALENYNVKTISERTYIKQKAYLIALRDGDIVKAKQLIHDELKNYTQDSKDYILAKLDSLKEKSSQPR